MVLGILVVLVVVVVVEYNILAYKRVHRKLGSQHNKQWVNVYPHVLAYLPCRLQRERLEPQVLYPFYDICKMLK